jgi:hypothetical protein
MTLINHSTWDHYVPDPWPEGIPNAVLFSKRTTGDHEDWYAFSQGANAVLQAGTAKYLLTRNDVSSPWTVLMAGRDASKMFPPNGSLLLEDDADVGSDDISVRAGRIWQAGELVIQPPPAPSLTEYAKAKRYEKEISNLAFGPYQIAMDDRSKSLILGAYITAQRNPAWTTVWQAENGEAQVDAATIAQIFDAMQARVNSCFTVYSTVAAGISGGTITTTTAIDEAFAGVT